MGQGRGKEGGKILEETLLRGFEGIFRGWGPGGEDHNKIIKATLGCLKDFGRSGPGTTDPF